MKRGKMKKNNGTVKVFVLMALFAITTFAGEKEVTDVVNQYLTATKGKEVKAIDKIVSENADFIRINNIINKRENHNKSDFLDIVKSGKFYSWSSTTNVKLVDQQETIAVAYIEYESKKLVQNEYITLVLSDGNWEIVNSVCSLSKK